MRKIICLFGFLGLFIVSGLAFSDEIKNDIPVNNQTDTPGKFLQEWASEASSLKNTLILLDLDDTSFSPPLTTWLGSSDLYYQLHRELCTKYPHLTSKQATDYIDPLIFATYKHTPVILTDRTLPQTIEQLEQKGATVAGLTARSASVAPITLKQLKQVGLSFTPSLKDGKIKIHGNNPVAIKNGVIFAGHGHTKGDVLVALLKSGKLDKPLKVMLVDDRKEHLKSTGEALNSWDKLVDFIPVLCTYAKARSEVSHKKTGKSELLHFIHDNRHDSKVKELIKHDLYTAAFVTEQCEEPASDNKAVCKTLLPIIEKKQEAL